METTNEKRRSPIIFIIGLVMLAGLTGYFAWQNVTLNKELKACSEGSIAEAKDAKAKIDSMSIDLSSLSSRYDSLGKTYSDLDSLFKTENARLENLKKELQKYQSGATGGKSYAEIQKEYVLLKARQEDYLKQIDMLKEDNRLLTLENIDVKSDLLVEQDKTKALTAKVDNLNGQIKTGSALFVTYVKADAVQVKGGNEVSVTKAKKVEKLRCCFTIGKNTLTLAGAKDFYLRVIDPSGEVIKNDGALGSSGEINIKDGVSISYTTKATVLYENEAVETCIYTFGKTKSYAKGEYKFEIYGADGQKIGFATVTLK